jgi:hypothetical protein
MLSVRLEPDILEVLDRLASEKGLSRSELIRQALVSYFQREIGGKVEKLPVLHLGGAHPKEGDLYPEPI